MSSMTVANFVANEDMNGQSMPLYYQESFFSEDTRRSIKSCLELNDKLTKSVISPPFLLSASQFPGLNQPDAPAIKRPGPAGKVSAVSSLYCRQLDRSTNCDLFACISGKKISFGAPFSVPAGSSFQVLTFFDRPFLLDAVVTADSFFVEQLSDAGLGRPWLRATENSTHAMMTVCDWHLSNDWRPGCWLPSSCVLDELQSVLFVTEEAELPDVFGLLLGLRYDSIFFGLPALAIERAVALMKEMPFRMLRSDEFERAIAIAFAIQMARLRSIEKGFATTLTRVLSNDSDSVGYRDRVEAEQEGFYEELGMSLLNGSDDLLLLHAEHCSNYFDSFVYSVLAFLYARESQKASRALVLIDKAVKCALQGRTQRVASRGQSIGPANVPYKLLTDTLEWAATGRSHRNFAAGVKLIEQRISSLCVLERPGRQESTSSLKSVIPDRMEGGPHSFSITANVQGKFGRKSSLPIAIRTAGQSTPSTSQTFQYALVILDIGLPEDPSLMRPFEPYPLFPRNPVLTRPWVLPAPAPDPDGEGRCLWEYPFVRHIVLSSSSRQELVDYGQALMLEPELIPGTVGVFGAYLFWIPEGLEIRPKGHPYFLEDIVRFPERALAKEHRRWSSFCPRVHQLNPCQAELFFVHSSCRWSRPVIANSGFDASCRTPASN